MRKLNSTQKKMIDRFVEANRSAPASLSCSIIDPAGEIENKNWYETVWSDIERYYSDSYATNRLHVKMKRLGLLAPEVDEGLDHEDGDPLGAKHGPLVVVKKILESRSR